MQLRIVYITLTILYLSLVLVGCQTTSTITSIIDTYKILQNKDENRTAFLACSASIACYFARVDATVILDEKTKRPTQQAIDQGLLKVEGSILNNQPQYALSLVPARHEIMVWFHPVSEERAEQFHLIHTFKPKSRYVLSMYRQKSQSSGSLLQMATPGESCVDLLRNDTVERRFCRAYNVLTGQGEFVEKQI